MFIMFVNEFVFNLNKNSKKTSVFIDTLCVFNVKSLAVLMQKI